jgi:hypothetical protein
MLLLNAFSLNMLLDQPTVEPFSSPKDINVTFQELPKSAAQSALDGRLESAVGHADTATVLSDVLGMPVPCNRATVSLKLGDKVIVAQYVGPRLPEGATKLPEGAKMKFYLVTIWN